MSYRYTSDYTKSRRETEKKLKGLKIKLPKKPTEKITEIQPIKPVECLPETIKKPTVEPPKLIDRDLPETIKKPTVEPPKLIDREAVVAKLVAKQEKRYRFANKQRENRDKMLAEKYGVSLENITNIRKTQKVCQICKCGDCLLVLDHCHSTSKLRGMLCTSCNTGLGMFRDDTQRLTNAVEYLKKPFDGI